MAQHPATERYSEPEESLSSIVRRAGCDATALADADTPSMIALSARAPATIVEPRVSAGEVTALTEPGHPAWFEEIYRSASGDPSRIPWADAAANPHLVHWLNAHAPSRLRPGARVVVVGCGLGDDVAALIERGYDAVGFDVSPTSIDWARRRFPEHARSFFAADLMQPPPRLRRRFDLVAEVYTLQALHPSQRQSAAASVAAMACPRGAVLAIARARADGSPLSPEGPPPWAFTAAELAGVFERAGMCVDGEIERFEDDQTPPVPRLRALFAHG
jgi:SAM-dependent methyltransferase